MFTSTKSLPQGATIILAFCCGVATHAYEFVGGTGGPNDPYGIATAEQLISIGSDPNLLDKHYILLNDLDLDPNLPGGRVFTHAVIAPDMNDAYDFQGIPFTGCFDGNDCTIRNLTIPRDSVDFLGLFGAVGEEGVVENLGIEAADVGFMSGEYRGALAGRSEGRIVRCRAEGRVSGLGYIGGLVGENRGTILHCRAGGDFVFGFKDIGGLVGGNDRAGRVVRCAATCEVVATLSGRAGGLAGFNMGYIADSYATGDILPSMDVASHLGGLVGDCSGMIANCRASGNILGEEDASQLHATGGLVGRVGGKLINCYATGNIYAGADSRSIGGLAGIGTSGYIINSYAVGRVSAGENSRSVGGLVGETTQTPWIIIEGSFWDIETSGLSESAGGIGLTTAQMQDMHSFLTAGWDFVSERDNGTADVWLMPEDGGYATLALLSDVYEPPGLAGSGTREAPFRIGAPEDLGAIGRHDLSAHYELTSDIDLTGITWRLAPIVYFGGRLNGAGHIISHLTIRGREDLGLFGYIGGEAVVADLGIEDADIAGEDHAGNLGILAACNEGSIAGCYAHGRVSAGVVGYCAGGLVGSNGGRMWFGVGAIIDCHTVATLTGGDSTVCLGGLVGYNWHGTVTGSYAACDVSSGQESESVGGLTGYNGGTIVDSHASGDIRAENDSTYIGGLAGNSSGTIEGSYATVTISAGEDANDLGGLVGNNADGIITGCYSSGDVHAGDRSEDLGGLVGSNHALITSCYATGSILAGADSCDLGGLVGDNWRSAVIACYATGDVRGGQRNQQLGGLVGNNARGTVTDCYAAAYVASGYDSSGLGGLTTDSADGYTRRCFWDIETSGLAVSAGGKGLATALMHDANTYLGAGWDMADERNNGTVDLWFMPETGGYPLLTAFSETHEPHQLDGSGTNEDPYEIATAEDLGAMRHYSPSACYELTADVDLSGITWTVAPCGDFNGRFDGGGSAILNLAIDGGGFLGLFRSLGEDSVLQNVQIEDANIVCGDNAHTIGILAARNAGDISDCFTSGRIRASDRCTCLGGLLGRNGGEVLRSHTNVAVQARNRASGLGGLTGDNRGGTIGNSYAIGKIQIGFDGNDIGGLIGNNRSGQTMDCHATGDISGGYSCAALGGLVGNNRDGQTTDCHATGDISGGYSCAALGGLVGKNEGRIVNCFATGNISGGHCSSALGGLAGTGGGYAWYARIDRSYAAGNVSCGNYCDSIGGLAGSNGSGGGIHDCYATGSVTSGQEGRYIGGLVGENALGTVVRCYAAGSVLAGSSGTTLGGLVGAKGLGTATACYFLAPADGGGPDNGAGVFLTDVQMKQRASFVGCDFEGVWTICEGKDYPRLWWEPVQCGP